MRKILILVLLTKAATSINDLPDANGTSNEEALDKTKCVKGRDPCWYLPKNTWDGVGDIQVGPNTNLTFTKSQLSMAKDSRIYLSAGSLHVKSSENSNFTILMKSKATISCSYGNVFDSDKNYCSLEITDRRIWMDTSAFLHVGTTYRYIGPSPSARKSYGKLFHIAVRFLGRAKISIRLGKDTTKGTLYLGKNSFWSLSDAAEVEIEGNFAMLNLLVPPRFTIGYGGKLINQGIMTSSGFTDIGPRAVLKVDRISRIEIRKGCKLTIADETTLELLYHVNDAKAAPRVLKGIDERYRKVPVFKQRLVYNYSLVPNGTELAKFSSEFMSTLVCAMLCNNFGAVCDSWTFDGEECRLGNKGLRNAESPEAEVPTWSGVNEDALKDDEKSACIAINDDSVFYVMQDKKHLHFNESEVSLYLDQDVGKDDVLLLQMKYIRGRFALIHRKRTMFRKGTNLLLRSTPLSKEPSKEDLKATFILREVSKNEETYCRIEAWDGKCFKWDDTSDDKISFSYGCDHDESNWKFVRRNVLPSKEIETGNGLLFWRTLAKRSIPGGASVLKLDENSVMDIDLPKRAQNDMKVRIMGFRISVEDNSVFKIDSNGDQIGNEETAYTLTLGEYASLVEQKITVRDHSHLVITSGKIGGRISIDHYSAMELTSPQIHVTENEISIKDGSVLALSSAKITIIASNISIERESKIVCRGEEISFSGVNLEVKNNGKLSCNDVNIGRFIFKLGDLRIPYNTEIFFKSHEGEGVLGSTRTNDPSEYMICPTGWVLHDKTKKCYKSRQETEEKHRKKECFVDDGYYDEVTQETLNALKHKSTKILSKHLCQREADFKEGMISVINQHWSLALCLFEFLEHVKLHEDSVLVIDLSMFRHQRVVIGENITVEKEMRQFLHMMIDQ